MRAKEQIPERKRRSREEIKRLVNSKRVDCGWLNSAGITVWR
jgi:hypothetical protein